MTLQPTSQPRTKVRGLARHQVIMLGLGFPAILTGTILIWANKTIHESAHFTTWHAVSCMNTYYRGGGIKYTVATLVFMPQLEDTNSECLRNCNITS